MGCPKGQLFLFAHLSGKKQSTFALWNGGFSCLYVVFAPVGGAYWVCLGFGWMYMKEAQASATQARPVLRRRVGNVWKMLENLLGLAYNTGGFSRPRGREQRES